MTTDPSFQDTTLNNQKQSTSIVPGIGPASNDFSLIPPSKSVVLDKLQLLAYQEKAFAVISQNNGKLNFTDLLEIMGGPTYKQALYKALMLLAKQGKVTRIRGIGKKRIEFYYYDTLKIKKPAPSASVSFIH